MKVICLENAYLIDDLAVQTTVKGSLYTVVDAVKNPRPTVKPDGSIVEFAPGFWYQFAETGNLWHHEARFKRLPEEQADHYYIKTNRIEPTRFVPQSRLYVETKQTKRPAKRKTERTKKG